VSAPGPWGGGSGPAAAPPALGVMRLIGDTLRLLGSHFYFLFPIAFVPSLGLVAVELATGTGEPIAIDPETGAPPADFSPGPYLISFLLNVVVASVISGVMCLAALDAVIGKRHTIGEYLRQTLRHLGPIVVLGTILYVLAGIGLVLFILPGLRQFLERHGIVLKPPLHEDVALAFVQDGHRPFQQPPPRVEFVALGVVARLVGILVLEPVLPLRRALAIGRDRGVERRVATRQPPVHRDDLGLGHVEVVGDLRHVLGAQVPFLQRADLGLRLPQVEEQFLLRRGRAELHERPRPQDVFLDRRPDPPHRIGRQPEAALRIEPLDRLHQPHVRLRDHLGLRKPVAPVAHGDLGREPQVRRHQPVRGFGVLVVHPALRQHVLLFRLEHGETPDLLKIPVEPAFRARCWKIRVVCHSIHP
jgi:hypothetical protein